MSGLGIFQDRSRSERVIGTYLFPYRLLTDPDWNDAYSATAVIATSRVAQQDILITRNGGLFVRPPAELSDPYIDQGHALMSDFEKKVAFEETAAHWFNAVICEFALLGIVSEPATPVHVSRGVLIDLHALVTGAGGGRELYRERSVGPAQELVSGLWLMHPVVDMATVEQASQHQISTQLGAASENLPALVAGAYSTYSRRQLAEAVVDSWIVMEQLLDWYWTQYRAGLTDKSRKERLADTRTYSAAIRIELLQTAKVLPEPLCDDLQRARRHRNELAHRARVTGEGADVCLTAMRHAIEFFSGRQVEPPLSNTGVTW
jgi:hypothetical protein